MGAWGHGHFENDTALDWIAGLAPPKPRFFGLLKGDPIDRCLDVVTRTIECHVVDSDVACEMLAAAECVALVRGHPMPQLPNEVLEWHEQIKDMKTCAFDDDIHQWVIEAVERIIKPNESELRELWEETEELPLWLASVDELLERLKLPPANNRPLS